MGDKRTSFLLLYSIWMLLYPPGTYQLKLYWEEIWRILFSYSWLFYWEKLRVHPEVWCEFLCREMLMAQEYMRNEEAFKMVRAGDCITICRQEDTHGSVINQWGCISCQSMLYMLNWFLSWFVGQCVHVDTRILCHRFLPGVKTWNI